MSEDKTSAETSASIEQAKDAASDGGRVQRYLKEVRLEMKQVAWPTWNQIRETTFVVLFFALSMAVYIRVVDAITVFFYRLVGGR